MNRIPFEEVQKTLAGVLVSWACAAKRAQVCARLFAETTRDGVYTHGINRFPRFVATIQNGSVDVKASRSGWPALARWSGGTARGAREI